MLRPRLTLLWPLLTVTLLTGMTCRATEPGPQTVAPTVQPTRTIADATVTPTGPIASTPQPVPTRPSQPPAPAATLGYEIGQPVLTELYISPTGSDGNDGLTISSPLQTLTAAWAKIPEGITLNSTGYRLNLLPGEYPCEPAEPDNCQNYFAERLGDYQYPIILRAYNPAGPVTLRGGLDVANVAFLYLIDLTLAGGDPLPTNQSGNNLLHLANVHHVLLRNVVLDGPDCANDTCNNLQEVFKVNQAQYLYVEDSVIGGAWHTAADYFAVQYGHLLNNRLHTAGQWCMYLKGGSAYLRLEGNELHDCQLGFQAGQSANLATMRAPWLHYDAYDIKFVNNVLHHLPGVALSVSGGYNILMAYNTLYRVGTSADPGYALVQAVQGERGCSATDELPDPLPTCTNLIAQGGWGPNILTENLPALPNRNIYIYNNLIYNPSPDQTLYTHLNILGPIELPAGFQNLPASVATDQNMVIAGNLIWNGPSDHPLGVDDTTGCPSSNPTCNAAQLVLSNTINSIEPQLVNPLAGNPSDGNYRPVAGSNLFSVTTYALPDFAWDTFTPAVPTGALSNIVEYDRDGNLRTGPGLPGAYTSSAPPSARLVYLPIVALVSHSSGNSESGSSGVRQLLGWQGRPYGAPTLPIQEHVSKP